MNKIVSAVKVFAADENGITSIEYGLMAALIGAAIVAGVAFLSTGLTNVFTSIKTRLSATI